MFHRAKRTAERGPSGRKQGVERSGKRTNVIGTRSFYITHHVNPNCSQPRKRYVGRHITKLRTEDPLHCLLHLPHRPTANEKGPCFREGDPTLSVHNSVQALRNSTPE